jgi:hypothetical protein
VGGEYLEIQGSVTVGLVSLAFGDFGRLIT